MGRVEAASPSLVANENGDSAGAAEGTVIADGRVGRRVRAGSNIAAERRTAGSGPRRDVDDASEALPVLRRIRSLEDVDERDVARVELASDLPIESLRDRDAVDDVIDVAVVAVHMHDAVRAARRARQLNQQLRETAARRRSGQQIAVERRVRSAAARRGRANDGDVADLLKRPLQRERHKRTGAAEINASFGTEIPRRNDEVVRPKNQRRELEAAARVAGRAGNDVVPAGRDRRAGDGRAFLTDDAR